MPSSPLTASVRRPVAKGGFSDRPDGIDALRPCRLPRDCAGPWAGREFVESLKPLRDRLQSEHPGRFARPMGARKSSSESGGIPLSSGSVGLVFFLGGGRGRGALCDRCDRSSELKTPSARAAIRLCSIEGRRSKGGARDRLGPSQCFALGLAPRRDAFPPVACQARLGSGRTLRPAQSPTPFRRSDIIRPRRAGAASQRRRAVRPEGLDEARRFGAGILQVAKSGA